MQGAARMVLQTGLHPAAIKDSVTSKFFHPFLLFKILIKLNEIAPGGCTIAGLLALEDGRVRSTIARCIQVTALHAGGLGKNPEKK